jgi:transposase-like protein
MTDTIEPTVAPEPKQCPFCHSPQIVATGRKVTPASYWRCEGCGQLWHPERLPSYRTAR